LKIGFGLVRFHFFDQHLYEKRPYIFRAFLLFMSFANSFLLQEGGGVHLQIALDQLWIEINQPGLTSQNCTNFQVIGQFNPD